ncbi:hypothetical protein BDR04DRAFT_1117527 [Suillus decipiens]|nr:hypothetical protein BDR04DRAFT_1117527 [Suillus decipiens]
MHEEQLQESSSTSLRNQEFLSESTGNMIKRQLHPRTNISTAPEPATQITLGSSSKSSKFFKMKRQLPFRQNIGTKSKHCCRDGQRVELFENPLRKRAYIDYGNNEEVEQKDKENKYEGQGQDEEQQQEQNEEQEQDLTNKEVTWKLMDLLPLQT